MQVSFPIFLGGSQDPEVVADQLNQLNERGAGGYFPMGDNNFWHGGVHYETDEPVRAVGDGVIVAYRMNRHALRSEIDLGAKVRKHSHKGFTLIDRGELVNAAWRSAAELNHPTLEEEREQYSNSFVLTKHQYKTPRGTTIPFFVLAMHLLPFENYEATHHANEPSIFHREGHFVKLAADGGGLAVRDDVNGEITRVIPLGASFAVDGGVPDADLLTDGWVAVAAPYGPGVVNLADGVKRVAPSSRAFLVDKVIDSPPAAEMGLAVHKAADQRSEVLRIAPKGTLLEFAAAKPKKGKFNELLEGGFVSFTDASIEVKRTLKPERFDAVVACNIPVKRGDILGYPGPYRVTHNLVHLEIFLGCEPSTLFSCSDDWGGKGYRIPAGFTFHDKVPVPNPLVPVQLNTTHALTRTQDPRSRYARIAQGWLSIDAYHYQTLRPHTASPDVWRDNPRTAFAMQPGPKNVGAFYGEAVDEYRDAAGELWVELAFEGKRGWAKASALDGKSLYQWPDWRAVEEHGKYSEDGLCDAETLIVELDKDGDGTVSYSEFRDALRDPVVSRQIRRSICKHPTEWASSADGKKYERLLAAPWWTPPKIFDAMMKHHKRLQWWDEVGGLPPASGVWHVHPVAFLAHLRKLVGITAAQLREFMFSAQVRAYKQQNLPILNNLPAAYAARLDTLVVELNTAMKDAEVMTSTTAKTRVRQCHFLGQTCAETMRYHLMLEKDDPNLGLGNNARYAPFYGRGIIQLTWAFNYAEWYTANQSLFTVQSERAQLARIHEFIGVQKPLSKTTMKADVEAHAVTLGVSIPNLRALLDNKFGNDPHVAFQSGAWFWGHKFCNPAADGDNATTVTHAVNGGEIGLADRMLYTQCAREYLIQHFNKPL